MPVYDADAHVAESLETFSDKYLDPTLRSRRPQVVEYGGRPHWLIDYQVFPRFTGPGPQSMGSPAHVNGKPSIYTTVKTESLESIELSDPAARLRNMDEEGLDVQVLYPSLFLEHYLSPDPVYAAGLCASYNRWLADKTSAFQDRLKWAAIVHLEDIGLAVQEVRRAREMGAAGIMIPGTAGDRLLHHPSLLPFFEETANQDLPIAVHVGWSSPSLNRLAFEQHYSMLIPFTLSMLIGFISVVGSGLLDRFPTLRVAFLEGGCQWIHFLQDRMDHRYAFSEKMQARGLPISLPGAKERVRDYFLKGNVYFSFEVEDTLLPQALELAGASQFLFASDMPHADRERFAVQMLRERGDLDQADLERILGENPRRFYGL